MPGLLEGIGYALARGGQGAAKGFVDAKTEEIKNIRQENLLRIQDIMARGRMKEGQTFTAGENKLNREAAAKEAGLGRTHTKELNEASMLNTNINAEADRTERENRDTVGREFDLAKLDKTQNFQKELLTETNRLAIEREKATDADARARIEIQYKNAIEVAKETARLSDKAKAALEKNYDFLAKIMPPEEARAMTIAGLRTATTEKERAQLTAWASTYREELKAAQAASAGIPLTPQQKQEIASGVTSTLGYSPSDLFQKKGAVPAATPKKSLFDQINERATGQTPAPAASPSVSTQAAPLLDSDTSLEQEPKGKWLDNLVNGILKDISDREIELEGKRKKGLLQ